MVAWLYWRNQRMGPFDDALVRQRLEESRIPPDAWVWLDSLAAWVCAAELSSRSTSPAPVIVGATPGAQLPPSPPQRPAPQQVADQLTAPPPPAPRAWATAPTLPQPAAMATRGASDVDHDSGTPAAPAVHRGLLCPYCLSELTGIAHNCPRCDAPHHPDCWQESQDCAVLGCRPEQAAPAPVADPYLSQPGQPGPVRPVASPGPRIPPASAVPQFQTAHLAASGSHSVAAEIIGEPVESSGVTRWSPLTMLGAAAGAIILLLLVLVLIGANSSPTRRAGAPTPNPVPTPAPTPDYIDPGDYGGSGGYTGSADEYSRVYETVREWFRDNAYRVCEDLSRYSAESVRSLAQHAVADEYSWSLSKKRGFVDAIVDGFETYCY